MWGDIMKYTYVLNLRSRDIKSDWVCFVWPMRTIVHICFTQYFTPSDGDGFSSIGRVKYIVSCMYVKTNLP